MIRIVIFGYLLCGGALIVWQSKRWWRELELHAHKALSDMSETEIPTWICVALVAIGAAVALIFDLAFWPRAVWIMWRQRRANEALRKLRRWADECDDD